MQDVPHHVHCVQSLETLEGGGLGASALALHVALKAAGHASSLLTTHAPGRNGNSGTDSFARLGPTRAFFAPGFAARARALAVSDSTVFHQHGFYAYTSAVCGLAARKHSRPLICHPQGMLDPWILRRSRLKKRIARWLYEDATFRHARLWRALTVKEADQIRALGFGENIAIIPNGIDTASYTKPALESERPDGWKNLLFLGRLHPKKGIDLLLNAWASLRGQRRGWRLVLAGPDENHYLSTVRALMNRYELRDSIVLPGPLIGDAKREILRTARAFVLCSYSEGLPMAVLEAMASSLPVIVSDECNLPEISRTGCGWVCGANEASLREAMLSLLRADDAELHQRGAAGRSLAVSTFDSGIVAATLHAAAANLLP